MTAQPDLGAKESNAGSMPFWYIDQAGIERPAVDQSELTAAIVRGELQPSGQFYDPALGQWQVAAQSPVLGALWQAAGNASLPPTFTAVPWAMTVDPVPPDAVTLEIARNKKRTLILVVLTVLIAIAAHRSEKVVGTVFGILVIEAAVLASGFFTWNWSKRFIWRYRLAGAGLVLASQLGVLFGLY